MLDVVTASIMTAVVLVPSMNIMRRSLAITTANELRQEMSTLATSTMERQLAASTVNFRRQSYSGLHRVSGQLLRYRVIASDRTDYGGVAGQLLGIAVTTWHDENRNRRPDSGEATLTLYSKVARR